MAHNQQDSTLLPSKKYDVPTFPSWNHWGVQSVGMRAWRACQILFSHYFL